MITTENKTAYDNLFAVLFCLRPND
jgi:hypothetical protein